MKFNILTPADLIWPLTSTINNRILVLLEIVFLKFFDFHPCWPQMTLDLYQKPGTLTQNWSLTLLTFWLDVIFSMLNPKNKTVNLYNLPNWSYWDYKTLTLNNIGREGRTHGSCFELFWWKGTFEVRFWHKKYVFPEKMQKVNGGQKSHTGSPGVDRYADYNGPTPNPNGHLVFELSPKNRFLPPNWPFLTLDHMTFLFENIPLPHSLLVPKYQLCRTLSLGIIGFWIFYNCILGP